MFRSFKTLLPLLVVTGMLRAAPCDLIVSGKYVVTMDGQFRVVENGAVAITGARIAAVGAAAGIDRAWQPKRRIDRSEALIAPGLINTHTHAAMSLFRGIADDLKLQDWLEHYIFPAEAKNVTPDFVRWGTRLAVLEMLLSGTTTFTDMYYFEDVAAEVAREAGIRGVLGETVIGFPVADAKTPAEALLYAERFIRKYRNDDLVTPAVAPHAQYTNSDSNLRASRALANQYKVPLLIHLSETRKENDDLMAKRQMTPTRLLDSLGLFDGTTVAAHCVWVDAADRDILRKRNVGVAHNPSSNMKLSSGAAPVVEMLRDGMHVGLGTDGPAGSNNDFDMFEEIDLASKLQKLIRNDPEALPARQAFAMATIEGARVLGLGEKIGSLEAGKRADLITVDLSAPNAVPLYDVYSQLVSALKGSNVLDVIVNGREVVRDRKCLTEDQRSIVNKAMAYGAAIAQQVRQKH